MNTEIVRATGMAFLMLALVATNGCKDEKVETMETAVDIDGNRYTTVRIGTQVWMVENLKTTKFNDGTPIPNVTDNLEWANLTTSAYCWFNNYDQYKSDYGALYNWYAVSSGKLCPAGWHVPTEAEWTVLSDFLGGKDLAGGKLKEVGIAHWIGPNTGATNSSGFTCVPGGWRSRYNCLGCNNGEFAQLGYYGMYWSSTAFAADPNFVNYHLFYFDQAMLGDGAEVKTNGFSVRLIKDSQ